MTRLQWSRWAPWVRAAVLATLLAPVACAASTTNLADANAGVRQAAAELGAAIGVHRLVLLGELHGTREVPALIAPLVDRFANEGPVLLGLEIGTDEQAAIARFLASDGSKAAHVALFQRAYWHVPPARSDGRRNKEVVALIEHARALRASGRDVAVLAFDLGSLGTGDKASSESRDEAMAGRIRAAFGHFPRGRMLVLTGNVHAMRAKPSYAPPQMQRPMGSYLGDLSPFSVNITAKAGQFRACMDDGCRPHEVTPASPASGPDDGITYDYQLVLPRLTVARLID